jgi:PAS domain-containing protein
MKADAELLRALVADVLDDAIVMFGIAGYASTWNRGAKRVYRYTPEEMVGVHFSELCSDADVAGEKPQASSELT